MMDPRIPERTLSLSPAIANCAIVGNKFILNHADFLCLIVELAPIFVGSPSARSDVHRAVAAVNLTLPPPYPSYPTSDRALLQLIAIGFSKITTCRLSIANPYTLIPSSYLSPYPYLMPDTFTAIADIITSTVFPHIHISIHIPKPSYLSHSHPKSRIHIHIICNPRCYTRIWLGFQIYKYKRRNSQAYNEVENLDKY